MEPNTYIHRLGGGKVVGIDGSVSTDSRLDRSSQARGASFISFMSDVRNRSFVVDSHLACAVIDESFVVNSHVAYGKVETSNLNNVVVRGLYDPARLKNMVLAGGVTVEGCRVENFELNGPYLLHSDFDTQPRHFNLTEFGIPLHIIECHCLKDEPRAIIGCICRPISEWIEKKELLRRLFQKREKWIGPEVDLIHEYFKIWQRTS